jgi:type II secretory pathway pseudopilin PulG
MQDKQASFFFLEMVVVVIIMGMLSAVVIPHTGEMVNESKAASRDRELQNIQIAVTEMLHESKTGALEPVGPTTDISRVHTLDNPPLVLVDYLQRDKNNVIKPGCIYGFTADGLVVQFAH